MKQVLHSFKKGIIQTVDIPCPQMKAGHLLIQSHLSLISSGTEKMLIDFGKASLLNKARQQPDKVRLVLDKIKTDGLLSTLESVRTKLDQAISMGYCNVGTIIGVGDGVHEFNLGERVISNGPHAEIVCVPKNLCCKIPVKVPDDKAVFAVIGAIALQGIRLAAPTLGETFVVIGLGLIGLLTIQLLKANGCRVFATDINSEKVALANQFGAHAIQIGEIDAIAAAYEFSRNRGVDGVIITASTKSNLPIEQAAEMCRQKGRIVLVGVTNLELSRSLFYKKELSFQVSCSYGPGRYDSQYEESGHDYPIGFVRWTEQRNFEAFLDMLDNNLIEVTHLISARFPITEAKTAYALLDKNLGTLLTYPPMISESLSPPPSTIQLQQPSMITKVNKVRLAVIGAGNYASRILIPALANAGGDLQTIACSGGISGTRMGKKFGFHQVTTDVNAVFSNPQINTVIIATQHDSHANFVCQGLQSKKHVFVEKPLCLTLKELNEIKQSAASNLQLLMVGFNRRFSPHIQKIKFLLANITQPKNLIMTVNAGEIAANHWTQNIHVGGGRIVGEACHFIDLLRYLVNSTIISFQLTQMANIPIQSDKITITLTFTDGSVGTIHYLANGHRAFPKERLEIFTDGKILQLDNFRKLKAYGWKNFNKMNLMRQDKGQNACIKAFFHAIKNALPSPIPIDELFEVTKITLEIANQLNLSETKSYA